MLLKHIGLKPGQYSPLSKLKLACTIGDVEAVNKLLASGTDPLATGAPEKRSKSVASGPTSPSTGGRCYSSTTPSGSTPTRLLCWDAC